MIIFNLLFLATGISALLIDRQSENSNRECAHWCSENFRNPGAVCTSLAAQGRGPCFECGPAAPKPHTHLLCHEECVPIDNDNCGSCGNKCDEGTVCDDSKRVHSCEASSNIIAPRFERAAYDGRLDFRDIDEVLNLECCKECYETENCAFWWMANEVFGPCCWKYQGFPSRHDQS